MLLPLVFASLLTGVAASPPVQVATCEVSTPTSVPQFGESGGIGQTGDYALHVRFLNTSAKPVSRVSFQLDDGTTVVDSGKFSPNIVIDRSINLDATNSTGCSLLSVQFADGSQWIAAK